MSQSAVISVKKELRTTTDLMDLVDVLKRVAASQFQSLSTSERQGEHLFSRLIWEDFFRLIPHQHIEHPFLQEASSPLGIVIMTTDEGFLGGLNTRVIQKALAARGDQEAELIVLGERGGMVLRDLNEQFTSFPAVGENINSRDVERLRDYIVEQFH